MTKKLILPVIVFVVCITLVGHFVFHYRSAVGDLINQVDQEFNDGRLVGEFRVETFLRAFDTEKGANLTEKFEEWVTTPKSNTLIEFVRVLARAVSAPIRLTLDLFRLFFGWLPFMGWL